MTNPLDTFIAEAQELLEVAEADLLKIADGDSSEDILSEIFRCAHTIKGSAGLFGLDAIVTFTHTVENLLDKARDGELRIDQALLPILFECFDHIGTLVAALSSGEEPSETLRERSDLLALKLAPWEAAVDITADAQPDVAHDEGIWHISLQFSEDILQNGMDPIAIFRFLNNLGEIVYLVVDDGLLPVEQFNPECLYLTFELGLRAKTTKQDIEEAFMFVREGAQIQILPPRSNIKTYIELIQSHARGEQKLGEILIQCGVITQHELDDALQKQIQQSSTAQKPPIGEILLASQAVEEGVLASALEAQAGKRPSKSRFIRIDSDRLDQLINLVGEMVISQQRIDVIADTINDIPLDESVTEMKTLTEQVRDAALNLRMVPIGETFQKFRRIVRDVALSLDKDIKLELEGEETELDRSMVEKISDPITHIVRNAIDHGIEDSELRAQRNKPKSGLLRLTAHHDSGSVAVTIEDDGGGLNTEAIRQKAIAAKIIQASDNLPDHDVHQLIFHPGLSTASEVTNLSGRGVGMDVVKRNIEELHGNITITSTPERGTKIALYLPLTLAIIDGFHVGSGGTDFIIPHNAISECLDFKKLPKMDAGDSVNLRGDLVPFVDMNTIFALEPCVGANRNLLVVKFGDKKAGILVDQIHGEMQTVVKPLNPIFSKLKGVGGSSLLGNGEVAFIVDVPKLIEFAVNKEHQQVQSESQL